MRLLHTSDWHIGKTLFSKKRYEEFEKFLRWLVGVISENHIDVLLVSGDIFDTTTPSNKALELYYSFLCKIYKTSCRKIIITGGNHDSATSIDAPKHLLQEMDIVVIGSAREDVNEEVVSIYNDAGEVELVVCAVPYLRERDVRVAESSDDIRQKAEKLKIGVRAHYSDVVAAAKRIAPEKTPVIVMGHLFAASAFASDTDSERELYVGSLAHVDVSQLPQEIEYYALGHLHIKQTVAGDEYKRYSGSPLPMSFGEATQRKVVVLVEFGSGDAPVINEITVPVFQRLKKVSGDLGCILKELRLLKEEDESVWVEVEYTGSELVSDLKDQIESEVAASMVEVCRVRDNARVEYSLKQNTDSGDIELSDLDNRSVFKMCLEEHGVSGSQADDMELLYNEIISELSSEDVNAE